MDLAHPICCGLDVHQACITACLRHVEVGGKVNLTTREFGTTVSELKTLLAWLSDEDCPICVMESTGVYWKPVYNVLAVHLEVLIANAYEVKQRMGKKTDRADAKWLAELLAHDLIRPSFIPPPEISALRDLMRMRTTLVENRTQAKNRVLAVLETTNVKLASLLSDPFGVSGRLMMTALLDGNTTPQEMAQLAKGVLRRKIPQLGLALEGSFTEHHALMIRLNLETVDLMIQQIAQLEQQVAQAVDPVRSLLDLLMTIPGVNETAARTIIAEIGTDMSRFVTPGRLASWAGMCPGNNESAGKRRSGKTRRGNKYLRRVLAQCAWASRKTNTHVGRTFTRLQARIGGKKAAVATGHKILRIVFHLLNDGAEYDDGLYDRLHPQEEKKRRRRAVAALERLGYEVTIQKTA